MLARGDPTPQQLLRALHQLQSPLPGPQQQHDKPADMQFEIYMSRRSDKENQCRQRARREGKRPVSPLGSLSQNVQPGTGGKQVDSRSRSPAVTCSQSRSMRYEQYLQEKRGTGVKASKMTARGSGRQEGRRGNMSFQSKRIMEQQAKSGRRYVPIHYRTSQLLKDRQQRISEKRKQKELSEIIEERECTFRPKVNPRRKTATAVTQARAKTESEEQVALRSSENAAQSSAFDVQQSSESREEQSAQQEQEKQEERDSRRGVVFGRYANSSFNVLLDLIK